MSGIYYSYDHHNYSIDEDYAFMRYSHNWDDPPRPLKLMLYDINKTVYTGKTFQDLGISLQVSLIDGDTRDIVSTGPESSLPVEILVLDKDFNQENWTAEEFNSFIIEADDGRKRKRSLLCDKSRLFLRDGVATSHEISFRHTNQHMKKCEYRLGARIANPECGVWIKEAKTSPFTVKDKRIMSKKIYPASLDHEVWRLENISKDGPYHTRLSGRNINMVKDFLSEFNMDAVNLRDIVKMKSAKKWDATVNHAKTCALCPDKYLYFLPDSQPRMGVVFNIVKEILGLYSEESMFIAIDQLANEQKVFLHELMVSANAHPDKVVTFDDVNDVYSFEPNIVSTYPNVGPSYNKQESFESDYMPLFDADNMDQFLQDGSLQYLTDQFDPEDFLKNMFKENKSMQPLSSY